MDVTPLERLESVREELGISQGAFSKRCGWGRSQYAVIAGRLRKGETDNVHPSTAETIERVFGIRKEWLLYGTGARRVVDAAEQPEERYPERELALAEYAVLPLSVRREIESMRLHSGTRPSKARWMAYIDATLAAHARGERLGVPSVESEDETPPVAKRDAASSKRDR